MSKYNFFVTVLLIIIPKLAYDFLSPLTFLTKALSLIIVHGLKILYLPRALMEVSLW